MIEQPRVDAYEGEQAADGTWKGNMLKPPQGTIPYSPVPQSSRFLSGYSENEPVAFIPTRIDRRFLERGQQLFEVYCSPCHGSNGQGKTPVSQHMNHPPPSLHEKEMRALKEGEIFHVISQGEGFMPSLANQLSENERWQVVSFVKALQLAQHPRTGALPQPVRSKTQASQSTESEP